MRKIVVLTFVTLDGVIQAPGGPEEDSSGGFEHGGWSFGYWDNFMANVMGQQMDKPFDLLLGRRTYEIFAAYWPHQNHPPAASLNKAKKYVASKTLKSVEWQNSVLLKGDVVSEIRKLKAQNGPEIQVHGSGNLIQTLLKNNLVDQLKLKIYPITLGKGKKLFGDGTVPTEFKLVDCKASPKGIIVATYERTGSEIKKGSFA